MNRKRMIVIGACVVVALVTLGLLRNLHSSGMEGSLHLAELERGTLENIISTTGTLGAVGTVEVGAQVSGTIEEVLVDYNDKVKEGDVLAVLDRALFAASVSEAEAGVMKAEAHLEEAEAEYERDRGLHEHGYISEEEFVAVGTAVDAAKASLKSAEAARERAHINIDYAKIRSPIDGTVIERDIEPGQTIAASFQTPTLFLIAEDLTRMEIEADVDESDIGQIEEGQAVRFTVEAYPDETFEGVVTQIRLSPKTIQNVVHYTVVIDVVNENYLLLPGMTATVDFIVCRKNDVLLVPNAALNFEPEPGMFELPGGKSGQRGDRPVSADMSGHQGGHAGSPAGMELPQGMGRVFYLDGDGVVHVAILEIGATDDILTEVAAGSDIAEGTQVITGLAKGTESGKGRRLKLGPPGGGGGMRGAGF